MTPSRMKSLLEFISIELIILGEGTSPSPPFKSASTGQMDVRRRLEERGAQSARSTGCVE